MKIFFIFCIIAVAFCSCLNQKYLAKHQVVFKVEPTGNGKGEIKAYNTGNNKLRITVIDSNSLLLIQKTDTGSKNFVLPTVVQSSFKTTERYAQLAVSGKYYFPEILYPRVGDENSNNFFVLPDKLRYSENNIVVQLLTTPLKIRPAFRTPRLKDSLQTLATAELNVGVAAGLKRTWSVFKARPTEDDPKNLNYVSLSASGFFTIGGTNVKSITTTNYLMYDKTEPVASIGINFLFGWHNINIGGSIGKDHLLVPSLASRWLFDGRLWYGLTLAYDIWK